MSMQTIEDYLSTHAFFSGLDNRFIAFLSSCAKETQLEEGEPLFHQGERANKFYLLREGQVSVYVPAMLGPKLVIQTLQEDQILGWSWLIAPYRWTFQASSVSDTTLFEFDGHAILAHCEEDSKFGYELIKRFAALMSERLESARQKMMDQWDPPGFA